MGKDLEGRAGYQGIDVVIEVEGDADTATLEEIVRISESRCPMSDNLANVTPVSFNIVKKG